jgi:hypothetical protein
VHTLSAYQGVLLLTQGFLWTRLRLGVTASQVAFWCLLHGTFAILSRYTVAAAWGVGNETIQLMGGTSSRTLPRNRLSGDGH